MSIDDVIAEFARIPGARVGYGPAHPVAPDPIAAEELAGFFAEYPVLRTDDGYVEFLEKYAGASIQDEEAARIIDILGFSNVSTGMYEMDGEVVDDDGYLMFAQCVYHTIVDGALTDTYELDFAFAVSGDREPGVYRMASTVNTFEGVEYEWYAVDFAGWLGELVANRGVYPRPDLP